MKINFRLIVNKNSGINNAIKKPMYVILPNNKNWNAFNVGLKRLKIFPIKNPFIKINKIVRKIDKYIHIYL